MIHFSSRSQVSVMYDRKMYDAPAMQASSTLNKIRLSPVAL
jgi:hypothetical protein